MLLEAEDEIIPEEIVELCLSKTKSKSSPGITGIS